MKIIGHRGAKGEMPENTLSGIAYALDQGADGVEIDVHLSKDNELVVIHDDNVDRTTDGTGLIKKMKLSEIKKLDAGQGEKIPTLKEVIDVTKGKELFIEIKCHGAQAKVVEMISGNRERTTVKCFDHRVIKKIKEIDPGVKTACLVAARVIDPVRMIEDAKADMISINYRNVDRGLVEKCHKKNYNVFAWNIDDQRKAEKFREMGVDYIGTNLPSELKNL